MPTRADHPLAVLLALGMLLAAGCGGARQPDPPTPGMLVDTYRGELLGPGGPIPFVLEVGADSPALVDAHERVPLALLEADDTARLELVFDIDSGITLHPVNADRWEGIWHLERGELPDTEMACTLVLGNAPRFVTTEVTKGPGALPERWSCTFSRTDQPVVALLDTSADGHASGTFLTEVGDYRFLEGTWDGSRLVLCCFDGAHAFRFVATRQHDGSLRGDFWSRDSWHETFTARPDPDAALPDGFAASEFETDTPLSSLSFPDLDGTPRSLDDPAFQGRARVLIVFGSWCPNCRDATRLWSDWERRYRDRGLRVLGLAFERSADLAHQRAKLRAYVERQGIGFPVLIAGLADKTKASDALPLLDRVRAFPTTIFLDADGRAVAVHTGFIGPAAVEEHAALTARFEAILAGLLD